VGVTLEGAFSQEWSAVLGGAMTDGTTKAISGAIGIKGGGGEDAISNSGKVTVKANPDADSASVSATLTGAGDGLTVGFTYADAETTGQATATGIDGDEADDVITNESTGEIQVTADPESTSARVGVTVSGVTKGTGIVGGGALTDGTTKAISDATGIKGGDGDDTITNAGKIIVKATPDADSVGVSVDIGGALGELGLVGGFTYADAETTGQATATGIDGGAGNDTITNSGEMEITAGSTSTSVNVGVTAQVVTGMGAVMGGAITDGTTKAISSATGIKRGGGDDTITNSRYITVTSTSHSSSTNVSVNLAAAKEGVVAGFTYADATTSAEANAVGIGGESGGGSVTHSGLIMASATAETDSNSVSVDAGGTKMGLAAGVSLADSTSKSIAHSYGIDAGATSAANSIENSGYVIASSTADTSALSMSLEFKAALEGVTAGVSAARGEVTADADATAVRTGSGDDVIQNQGLGVISGASTARSNSKVVAVTVTGSLKGLALGASLADGNTEAEATATGIDSGDGRDTIVNDAAVGAEATANVESTNVAVTVAVTHPLKGVSAGVAISNAKTDATASATGITGGYGADEVINRNWLDVDATATTKTKQVTINFAEVGMAKADLSSTADAQATGVSGGAGTDTIGNEGTILATAIALADDTQGVGNFVGFASGDVDSLATATAIGIDAAGGTDGAADGNTVNNKTTGSITVLAYAKGIADQYVVQGGGAAFAEAGMEASSNAIGIVGDLGEDHILNEGTTNVTAWSEADATSFNFQLFGVQIGSAGINATATATGVDALDGQNSITNSATGSLNVFADVDTLAGSVIGGFSAGIVSSGTTAEAFSSGVLTGSGEDNIENDGSINVTATSLGQAGAGAIGLAALSMANSLAAATVEGINAGGGADVITNRGSMTVGAVRTGDEALVKADTEAIAFDYFSFVLSSLGARGKVTGIAGGGGDDIILNSGTLTVGDGDQWMVIGESFGFGGQIAGASSAHAGSTAVVTALGMDGGDGNDTLVNASTGQVSVDARSYSDVDSETYETFGFLLPALAESDAHGTASATGIQGGAGNDLIDNAGSVDAEAYTLAYAESFADMSAGIESSPFADSDAKAEANAVGIDTGSGSNLLRNSRSIDALGTAIAVSDASSDSDTLRTYADAYARSVATASGIQGGDEGNSVYNTATGTITVNAIAGTYDALGNITRADTDEEATAVAGAWNSRTKKWLPVTGDAVGISLGDGDDTVINDGSITVGSQSHGLIYAYTSSYVRNTISEARAVVAASAKGVAAGGGENSITNNNQITVSAWGNAFPSSDAWSRDYSAEANSIADVTARATGIEADGTVTNTLQGSINVTARATTYALTNTEAEIATATANLTATATGIATASTAARAEPDRVRNDGSITVTALAGEDWNGNTQSIALADTDAWVRSVRAEATGTSTVNAAGIRVGDNNTEIINNGEITVAGRARAHLSADAFSRDYTPTAITTSTANAMAYGIQVGDGDNIILNNGALTVTALGDAYAYVYAEENAGGIRDEKAYGTVVGIAQAHGLLTGNGNSVIVNKGSVAVAANSFANLWLDTEDNDIEVGTTATTVSATGIQTGSGDNSIANLATINVAANTSSFLWSTAELLGIKTGAGDDTMTLDVSSVLTGIANASTSFFGGVANASAIGIDAGEGGNVIQNHGSISMAANANAEVGIAVPPFISSWPASSTSKVIGIKTGTGKDIIENHGDIILAANATAFSPLISSSSSGVKSATATGTGIDGGNGNNVITNHGNIDVTAYAIAGTGPVARLDGIESTTATGIRTGDDNDTILNNGKIATTNKRIDSFWWDGVSLVPNISLTLGTAISSGGGNDTVILTEGSETNGSIELGDGDDLLAFIDEGSITGPITGGTGEDSLVFDGAGRVDVPLSEFEAATKQGKGTYGVNALEQVKRIQVDEGILEIDHDYQMASDGTFQAQVNGDGSHGQLKVNGTAELAGDLNVVKSPGLYRNGTRYDILMANDVNGVFGSEMLPEDTLLLSFRANTHSDRVEVETIAKSCTTVARNPVEMGIAHYLDKIMPKASGDLWRVLGEFQSLSEKEFRRAFKSFSPDSYDNATRASYFATKEYTDTLQKRMNTLRGSFATYGPQPRAESKKEPVRLAYNGGNIGDLLGAREQVEAERRWALWIDGFGQWGDQDPEIGFAGFDYSVYGGAIGLDYVAQDKLILGAGFGYSFSDIDLGDNQGDGDIKSVFGSLYGSYFTERAYVETVLSYGKQSYDNARNVVIGSIQRRAFSEHDGDLFSAYLAGGYYFPLRDWRWGPFGSLQYTYLDEDGFQETGAGSLNLALGPRSTDGLISRLGLRVGRVFRTKGVNLIPELSLAWLYDFDIDDQVITSSIAGAPGIWFSVPGQPVERHGAVFGAGITLVSGSGFRASLKYGGEFRDTYTAHALLGEVRFLF
jgi:uncharacterized protein with beta-barrel porin domain